MKKQLFILFAVALFAFTASSCEHGKKKSNEELDAKQEELMLEANRQVGMPSIKNFQERKLAKLIFELRDQEDLICYAYIVSQMDGKLVYIGECMGYGLPYSVQFTNPETFAKSPHNEYYIFPQADPNGLFMPTGLSATWLMMLDEKGEPHPVYLEPEIIVSPFPLHKI